MGKGGGGSEVKKEYDEASQWLKGSPHNEAGGGERYHEHRKREELYRPILGPLVGH
jgi:hypothetical protein